MAQANNSPTLGDGGTIRDEQTDNYLDKLKDRETWICWRVEKRDGEETKAPISPVESGYASTTDSETWSSFEEAVEYHESHDTDGIGFVFDTDDIIVGIDLDDCRDRETGELTEWADKIIEDVDTYWEVSPSGTGLHAYCVGFKPGDKTRSDIPESEGHIEMYDEKRFFTVSFNHLEDSREDVFRTNSAVSEVYEEYIADNEEDENDDSNTPERSKDLSLTNEQLINKAKNAENGEDFAALWDGHTVGYESQSEADLALCSHLAFWTQCDQNQMDSLFRKSGLMRKKWDEDRGDQTYGEITLLKAIDGCDEVYDPASDSPTESDLPESVELIERKGGYYSIENTADGKRFVQITNFQIEVKSYLEDEHEDEDRIVIDVVPATPEETYEVVAQPSDFADTRKFRNNVCTGRTTIFSGGQNELNDLKIIAGMQDAPSRERVTTIGIHDAEVVTPRGVYDEGGEVEEPSHEYERVGNSVEQDWTVESIGEFDNDEVAKILKLLPQIRNKERWLPVIGYYYASVHSAEIRDIEGEFPLLNITGETGSGKTTSTETCSQCFGLRSVHKIDSTDYVLMREMSATNCVPIPFDEYKPSDYSDGDMSQFHRRLRNVTRGAIEARGNASGSDDVYQHSSPVTVIGESEIQGNAERRRSIRTTFKKDVREDPEVQESFTKIQQYDLEEHARAVYAYAVRDGVIDEIEQSWRVCDNRIAQLVDTAEIDGLEFTALQATWYGLGLYEMLCDEFGIQPSITQSEKEEAIQYIAGKMGDEERTSHVDQWFSIASTLARRGMLDHEKDYIFQDDKNELRIKLTEVHHKIRKYVRDHDLDYDVLSSEKDYQKRIKEMSESNESYIKEYSYPDGRINRCIVLDYEQAQAEIDGFDHRDFDLA
ncbi:DUF927 domain-containing protein [Halosimplex rubrum]|uniref:DUF927 domain-containing protein n=1 Tax=Halosimplex rubrum TaxID=869889 RepID=A0A7D5P396_9EURY|nr:DUF927 domain-containing protein [Halosimplex rubrum]QLH78001.1 DUF927 domain-containing protein [Halosimplex rubrum]